MERPPLDELRGTGPVGLNESRRTRDRSFNLITSIVRLKFFGQKPAAEDRARGFCVGIGGPQAPARATKRAHEPCCDAVRMMLAKVSAGPIDAVAPLPNATAVGSMETARSGRIRWSCRLNDGLPS